MNANSIPELSVMTVNLYNGRYLNEKILPHLERTRPDVLLVQELWQSDAEKIRNALGSRDEKFSMLERELHVKNEQNSGQAWGIGVFTRLPALKNPGEYYYRGNPAEFLPNLNNTPAAHRSILTANVELSGDQFSIATTHFTYPEENGKLVQGVSAGQRSDLELMMNFLETQPELIFGGDLNAKRGEEVFDRLAQRYTDNVPNFLVGTHDTSVRPEATRWNSVIDFLFTTNHYDVRRISFTSGLSDHIGIQAWIQRVDNRHE